MKNIGLATCAENPNLIYGDQILGKVLETAGYHLTVAPWDDSSAQWSQCDRIIIRSTWDYHYRGKEFLNWCEKNRGNLMNPFPTVQWNASKTYLSECKKWVPIVPTSFFQSISEALEKSNDFTDEIILKPSFSASSRDTYYLNSRDSSQIEQACQQILRYCDGMIQPFVKSILTYGELSLVFFKIGDQVTFSHCTRKQPKQGDFRVQEEFGGSTLVFECEPSLIEQSMGLLNNITSGWIYARVDWMHYQEQFCLGELELIEPDLYLQHSPQSASLFLKAIENS